MLKDFFQSSSGMRFKSRTFTTALIAPGLFCLIVFLAVPCLSLIFLSLASKGTYGNIEWTISLENYKRLLGYNLFGWRPDFFFILLRSLREAFVTTVVCIILSYPLSFYIASRKTPLSRFVWLVLLTVPFCTNLVIRTYAWQLLLDPQSPITQVAAFFGMVPKGSPMYPGAFAVYLGMITTFLPFMALPLYSSIERLNWQLPQAAKDLYASPYLIFKQAILPQTIHGLYAGIIITFVPAMAMFVVTDILGGAKYMLIGNLIQQQFSQARDWPFGATLSLALMCLTLLSFALFRTSRISREGGSIY
ncbi:MAG: ABC transporter permease [Deltaproteobacteria bacterium]|jgi:spermidine/putrescine transport system permease protein|nr:ABC transporter permease [Deltaproteobacteria bacterium]